MPSRKQERERLERQSRLAAAKTKPGKLAIRLGQAMADVEIAVVDAQNRQRLPEQVRAAAAAEFAREAAGVESRSSAWQLKAKRLQSRRFRMGRIAIRPAGT